MKRILSSALVLGVFAMPVIGLVGCGEESSVKKEEKVSSPGGTTTTTEKETIKSTGSNPPANSAGDKVAPAK